MARDHQILIDGFSGSIWIRVSKIIGSFAEDSNFIPGSDFLG